MEFKELLENLYSEREYNNRKVEESKLDELMSHAWSTQGISENAGISFVLFQDGEAVFNKLNGVGGYSGVMIKSPHYIGIKTEGTDAGTGISIGYAGQTVIKKAFELGLGTCWVTLKGIPKETEHELTGESSLNMEYVIALGYPEKKSTLASSNVVAGASESSNNPHRITTVEGTGTSGGRLSVSDIVYLDEWGSNIDYNDLENRGFVDLFYHMKNSPSYKNMQPWRFVIKGGEIILGILNPRKEGSYTDAGIAMFLFEGLAHEMNIPGKWEYIDPQINSYDGQEYAVVGKFNI